MSDNDDHVHVHIAPIDSEAIAECMWAKPINVEAGIYELANFPALNEVDYTSGDLVQVADDGSGKLYVVGLAERRYQPVLLKYAQGQPNEVRAALAAHLEVVGARVEWIMDGLAGVAVPVAVEEEAFRQHVASAPYPLEDVGDVETE
jgi:hypothetical protein